MRKADSRRLVRDIRNLHVVSGGRGCIIFTTTNGEWIGGELVDILTGAAEQLGFAAPWPGWGGVVTAVVKGCLPDLLSEAIEAAEALGEQSEAEAAE